MKSKHDTHARKPQTTTPSPLSPWFFYIIVTVLVGVPFGLGKYFELNSPSPFDPGAYMYSAKKVLDGARIGVDDQPSAQVGTLLVNMLGIRLFGFEDNAPKILQGIFQAAALILMFLALQALWGRWAAAISTWLVAFYLSAPTIAKVGNVKEQYMIACMVMAVSCYILGQLRGKWWWTLLAGALVVCAPLFKQTGVSALGAMGLFVVLQPLLKMRTWKQTACDIVWLLAGVVLALGPICLWLASVKAPLSYYPYASLIHFLFPAGGVRVGGYVTNAREMANWDQVGARICRYYAELILPICLAVISAVLGLVHGLIYRKRQPVTGVVGVWRFVILLTVWWILDMAFVWISPRTYEQYFLPLNASALMLGAYGIGWYVERLAQSPMKIRWIVPGGIVVLIVIFMAAPIVIGFPTSPFSGTPYPSRSRGYVQSLRQVNAQRRNPRRGPWEIVGDTIREHSRPKDVIYVWGWVPGIYIRAQRLSCAPKAFEGNMHTISPQELSRRVGVLLAAFKKQPPKFIVDTRKRHYPWIRPPLELWPRTKKGFLPAGASRAMMDQYDASYLRYLSNYMQQVEKAGQGKADPAELERYKAMRPFRDYLVQNYKPFGTYGNMTLYERRTDVVTKH